MNDTINTRGYMCNVTKMKRKRIYAPRYGRFKRRRRFTRKPRRTRRRAITYTSRTDFSRAPFKIRGRKLSKKRYRSHLWRSTLENVHYRSIKSYGDTLDTPNSATALNLINVAALAFTTPFWKQAAGFQDPSYGILPTWAQAGEGHPIGLVIRGGRLWCCVANTDTFDNVTVRVQLAFVKGSSRNVDNSTTSNTVFAWFTSVGFGPRDKSWDYQTQPDYEEYVHPPVLDRCVDIQPGQSMEIAWKIRPVKIDTQPFLRAAGYAPVWFIYAGKNTNNSAAATTIHYTTGHNLSFAVTDPPI
jgi:hypothetical protein